jgi:aryl-alcohol dehydrogenase-like predicted oxidoreductase
MDLLIGTANFGQKYGRSSESGRLPYSTLKEIFTELSHSKNIGIDTSPEYGDSEKLIGELTSHVNYTGPITSKIPQRCYSDARLIVESAKKSLEHLNVTSIKSFLLHGFNRDLLNNSKEIKQGLEEIIKLGLSQNVGLSCYTESEVVTAKRLISNLTIFQIPENVIDQRKVYSKVIPCLKSEGCEFLIRSIFLQGYLLGDLSILTPKLSGLRLPIESVQSKAKSFGMDTLTYCVAYSKSINWASGVIVGIDSIEQLTSVNRAFNESFSGLNYDVSIADEKLIDPRKWT